MSSAELATERDRGDVLMVRHHTRLLVDVSVTRPTAKTELRLCRGAALAFAGAMEKRNHRSYDAACERDGSTLVPFALESYGAKGAPAQLRCWVAGAEGTARKSLVDKVVDNNVGGRHAS